VLPKPDKFIRYRQFLPTLPSALPGTFGRIWAVSRNALWLRPELVIRAEFAGWTGDGLVRQAAYKGFDLGKDPKKVRREIARRDR